MRLPFRPSGCLRNRISLTVRRTHMPGFFRLRPPAPPRCMVPACSRPNVMAQVQEGQWTPIHAVRAAAVAEVDDLASTAHYAVNFALSSVSQRTYRGLAFHR